MPNTIQGSILYFFKVFWNIGRFPPKKYLASHRARKILSPLYFLLPLMVDRKMAFIPRSDHWRGGWFGIKRYLFKKKKVDVSVK